MAASPQRERVIRRIQARYGADPEYLWVKYPNTAAFRHPTGKKWFALVTEAAQSKLGMDGEQLIDIINVKCDPIMVGSLLAESGFCPAYHMNKTSWISILLDDTLPDDRILQLVELSYDAVAPRRKKAP